jgi:predicted RNA-binding Zn-ribbon protein involved in translation (DUF1610 family)
MSSEIHKIKICDECGSEFYKDSSSMENLCPECSNILYGYENCEHELVNDRCIKCYWNGNSSEYLDKIKAESKK